MNECVLFLFYFKYDRNSNPNSHIHIFWSSQGLNPHPHWMGFFREGITTGLNIEVANECVLKHKDRLITCLRLLQGVEF